MAVLDASDFSWMKQRAGNDTAIPEILAGPVLRRVEPGGVSVWLATKTKGSSVSLIVTDPTGATVASTPIDTPPSTTNLGDNLNVVLATAVPTGQPLQPGVHYQYTLSLGQQSSVQPTAQTLATALGLSDLSQLCYGTDQLPSFALPPQDLSKVSLVHASCRHAGSDSLDALPVLDGEIANLRTQTPDDADFANARPHQMWLTGDQIYGDDLSDPWLALCIDLAGWLMGNRTEPYPKLLGPSGPIWPSSFPPPQDSKQHAIPWNGLTPWPDTNFPGIGDRGWLVWDAGFTSDAPDTTQIKPKSSTLAKEYEWAHNHLLALGEFYATYLLSYSPVLWSWPAGQATPDVPNYPFTATPADNGVANALALFGAGTVAVRRILANVPTYMVLDDHEVTDDFFMNRSWCTRVLGASADDTLGRRVIRNALLGYAMFQALGNDPSQWDASGSGSPGANLLHALDTAAEMTQTDPTPELLGIPSVPLSTPAAAAANGPPPTTRLNRGSAAISWHYSWQQAGWPFEVIALDCRTARGYGAGEVDPPLLLSDQPAPSSSGSPPAALSAFDEQLGTAAAPAGTQVTFVIAQTPPIWLRWIQAIQDLSSSVNWAFGKDAESWGLNENCFQLLLNRLAARNTSVVLLSGDVHFSFAAAADLYATKPWGATAPVQPDRAARVVQLTSSPMKNANYQTKFVGLVGWSILTNPESWAGLGVPTPPNAGIWGADVLFDALPSDFDTAPIVLTVPEWDLAYPGLKPDWRYRVQFFPGTKTPAPAVPTAQLQSLSGTLAGSLSGVSNVATACIEAIVAAPTEVVGVNNVCVVGFTGADPATAGVTQTVLRGPSADIDTLTGGASASAVQQGLTQADGQIVYTVPLAVGPDPWQSGS